jgi:predicted Zn-dependent peptidase
MRPLAWLFICCLLAARCFAGPQDLVLGASNDAFYQPQVYHLDNGMRVVMKQRPEVQKVSIRLVVELGLDHFPCEQSELPHVIEHMLFEGTDRYSNIELEKRVSDYGAHWNASTEEALTIYSFEVYGPYIGFALDTLYEVVSRSLLDEPAYTRAIEAARIESDNADGFKRIWQGMDMGGYGSERLFADMGVYCDPALDPYQFTHPQLMAALRQYYSAGNMTLVVVGNFDPVAAKQQIAVDFGQLEATETQRPPSPLAWRPAAQQGYDSRGVLGLSDTADVGIVWPTGGVAGDEYLALRLLTHYLSTRLYNVLRNESQLSYSPDADTYQLPLRGVLYLSADTKRGNEDQVIGILRAELEQVLQGDSLTAEDFEQTRRSLVIALAMSDLDNADIADYYSRSLYELAADDQFWNIERRLQAISYEQFIECLQVFFQLRAGVEYVDRTVFDTTRAMLLAAAVFLLIVLGVVRLIRRRLG